MSIKIGGIDLSESVINSEYRISVLEKVVDLLIQRTNVGISQYEIEKIREQSIKELNDKYPNAGIHKK
ncbi:hypothetical protein [Mangrovimonas sp. DI 80]|uniref:hypothetical protein n=1 Tax=Mangrovimonas sp. DI 80 TaxID=1779330 RepID=UPI0009760BEF|nr:hypothetical protein [Mangrovimonas sp. DI 80]OMP29702.1 hypothetical protein BKM32_16260 [Mangrovimonas sp. DI 80]